MSARTKTQPVVCIWKRLVNSAFHELPSACWLVQGVAHTCRRNEVKSCAVQWNGQAFISYVASTTTQEMMSDNHNGGGATQQEQPWAKTYATGRCVGKGHRATVWHGDYLGKGRRLHRHWLTSHTRPTRRQMRSKTFWRHRRCSCARYLSAKRPAGVVRPLAFVLARTNATDWAFRLHMKYCKGPVKVLVTSGTAFAELP